MAKTVRARTRVLRALAGSQWGARTTILMRFYRSFVEPACLYGLATWGISASDTNLQIVEVARNEGLRAASGLAKATSISRLRQLTGTISLRQLAARRAMRVVDQAIRLPGTPLFESLQVRVPCPSSLHSTPRKAGMDLLAECGLLMVSREPFLPPLSAIRDPCQLDIHYTTTTKTDKPNQQKNAAGQIINELRRTAISCTEIWTDGSVLSAPEAWKEGLREGERVSVLFSGGWYDGAISLTVLPALQDQFEKHHHQRPAFQIFYDDGTTHAYIIVEKRGSGLLLIIDEESTTEKQEMARMVPSHVGGAGVLISSPHFPLMSISKSLGAVCASFIAEIEAAIIAFEKLPSLPRGSTVLWATDSQSTLDALDGNLGKASDQVIRLWSTIC